MKTAIIRFSKMLYVFFLCIGLVMTSCETIGLDNNDNDSESIAVQSVELNTTSLTMKIGESTKVIATVYPSDATIKNVSWSSGNESIAIVSSDGTLTAVSIGVTTITVTTEDGDKSATCEVKVVEEQSLEENHVIEGVKTSPTTVTFIGRVNCTQTPDFKVGVLCSTGQIHEETADVVTTYELDETGAFELTLTGLQCETDYNYMSFVLLNGTKEYGEKKSFTTDPVEIDVTWSEEEQCYNGRINFTEADSGVQYGMIFSPESDFNAEDSKEYWVSHKVETQYENYRDFIILPTGVYGKQYYRTMYYYYEDNEKIYTYGDIHECDFPYPVFVQKSFIATFSEYDSFYSFYMETQLPEIMKKVYKNGICSDYLYMMSIYGMGSDNYAIYIDNNKYIGRDVRCVGYPYFVIDNVTGNFWNGNSSEEYIFNYLSEAEGTKIDCGISLDSQVNDNIIEVDARLLSMTTTQMLVSVCVVENPIIGRQQNTDNFYHPFVARYMSHTLTKGELLSLERNKEEVKQFNIEIDPDWNLENIHIYVLLKDCDGNIQNVNIGRIGESSDYCYYQSK